MGPRDRATLVLLLLAAAACRSQATPPRASAAGDAADAATDSDVVPEAESQDRVIDPSWSLIHTSCNFAFYAPPGFEETAVPIPDSCVTRYTSSECVIVGEYGEYSARSPARAWDPSYYEERVRVDGLPATLVLQGPTRDDPRLSVSIWFESGLPAGPGYTLSVAAACKDEQARDTARQMLESIRFVRSSRDRWGDAD